MCRVIKRNESTYEQLSVLLCQLLMDNIRVGGGGGLEIREVTPVARFEVKTVLGSLETRAGGLGDEMHEGQINPQLRGAGWSAPSLPP